MAAAASAAAQSAQLRGPGAARPTSTPVGSPTSAMMDDDPEVRKPAAVRAVEDAKSGISTANEAFMSRVNTLNSNYNKIFANANKREKVTQNVKRVERHEMLTFREVGKSLDKLILKRDLFLWVKCLWRGTDYVVDQMLERGLRYYPQHAMAELISQPKLFRGLPYVVKGKPFPTLPDLSRMDNIAPADIPCRDPKVAKLAEAAAAKERAGWTGKPTASTATAKPAAPSATNETTGKGSRKDEKAPAAPEATENGTVDARTAASEADGGSAASTTATSTTTPTAADAAAEVDSTETAPQVKSSNGPALPRHRFRSKNDPRYLISHKTFRRPTIVILSQLAHEKHNTEPYWFQAFQEYLDKQEKSGALRCSDLMTLRTIDSESVWWSKGFIVKRFAEFLTPKQRTTTYVGPQLLRKFMADHDLRNFMTTYVFVVDHKGNIRWMSSGPIADDAEVKHFHDAINTIEIEYYRSGGTALPSRSII